MNKRKEVKMNPIRKKILDEMKEIWKSLSSTTDISLIFELREKLCDLNKQFIERGRGKGKSKSFIKSVALSIDRTTYFPPSERFGSNEQARGVYSY